MTTNEVSPLAFVLRADEGRGAPLNIVGEPTLVKVGSKDSRGAVALFHLTAPPMSGPPIRVHSREDETFYLLEGELVFELAGRREVVGPADTVYLERGTPHRYQNFTDRDARLLIGVAPGGFQEFFAELSAATPVGGGMPAMDALQAIDVRYGIQTIGPPLLE